MSSSQISAGRAPAPPDTPYRPVIPTIQSIDFFGGIPERSIARGSFCKRSMGEYERLVNGSKQCGDGPFALSKGASPRLAGQSED